MRSWYLVPRDNPALSPQVLEGPGDMLELELGTWGPVWLSKAHLRSTVPRESKEFKADETVLSPHGTGLLLFNIFFQGASFTMGRLIICYCSTHPSRTFLSQNTNVFSFFFFFLFYRSGSYKLTKSCRTLKELETVISSNSTKILSVGRWKIIFEYVVLRPKLLQNCHEGSEMRFEIDLKMVFKIETLILFLFLGSIAPDSKGWFFL